MIDGIPEERVEFGKTYEMPLSTPKEELLIQASYGTLLSDFFKAKKENFPNWHELPEIRSFKNVNDYTLSWYIAVPKAQLNIVDQKQEEALWDS